MSFAARRGAANPPLSRNHHAGVLPPQQHASSSSSSSSTNGLLGVPQRPPSRPASRNTHFVGVGTASSAVPSASSSSASTPTTSSIDVRSAAAATSSSAHLQHHSSNGSLRGPGPGPPPASPTKEKMRQMGFRSDGVGGSHFKQKGDEESNIQVVVRVRGMAPGDAPPVQPILSTLGPHCSSINVAMEAPYASGSGTASSSSSAAAATATSVQSSLVSDNASTPREKTYNFDHVFAPEADQGMLYQSVVVPVLNEVLSGYNCTIFAYGQTGTGKTHTMEGDLASNMGTYSPEAGIIPRTLYRLFHTLEMSRDEYSVHASFVELYNEELRDLLSNDPPQPLGGGSNSNGLRMFEDPKGRGVVIQGLEDTPMKDAEHGLALLRKGSQKRQIASTRCNESSSRSHSVFSLTIHIKETTAKGEDVLRTGKLNLVDLAGSENIGRSGAENKRAREAGMINQSLLTLGRVINALVEKSAHVPYRESKLTRLLQESLGGRTKTCIIATVSSERENMEETLSTLDYALRAKSIRNRPEVNQRMTRAALIKEYVNEIERLKGDLLASREKNGIYLSPESWSLLQDEHESAKAQVEELRRNGEVAESKMITLKEQFEQNSQLLVKRENEAKSVKADCKEREDEVQRMRSRMEELQQAESEERLLREAYMRSERKLGSIAAELRVVAEQSTGDVAGLLAKLDRKTRVESKNRDVLAECQASLMSTGNQLEARVSEQASLQEQFNLDLSSQLREFQVREEEKLRSNRVYVEQRLADLATLAQQSGDYSSQTKRSIDGLVDDVRRKGEALVAASEDRNEELAQICQRAAGRLVQSNKDVLQVIRQQVEEMAEVHLASLHYCRDQVALDRRLLEEARTLAQTATQKELASLKKQNARLQSLLEEEKERSTAMREKVVRNVSQMLLGFTQERQSGMERAVAEMQESNDSSHSSLSEFEQAHTSKANELLTLNQNLREGIKEKERAAKTQKAKLEGAMSQSNSSWETEVQTMTSEVCMGSQGALQDLQETLKDVQAHSVKMRDSVEVSRQAQERTMQDIKSSADEGFETLDRELQSTLEDVQETCEGMMEGVQEHCAQSAGFLQDAGTQLAFLRGSAREYLSTKIVVDSSTGATPARRQYAELAMQPITLVSTDRKQALRAERKRKRRQHGSMDVDGTSSSVSVSGTEDSDTYLESDKENAAHESRFDLDDEDEDDTIDAQEGNLNRREDDDTLTRDRLLGLPAKKPLRVARTTAPVLKATAPLREQSSNQHRPGMAARATGLVGTQKKLVRPPSGLSTTGSMAKKARQ